MSGHMEVYDMLSPKHMGALQQPTSEEENRGAAAATKSPLHAAAVRLVAPPTHVPFPTPPPLILTYPYPLPLTGVRLP